MSKFKTGFAVKELFLASFYPSPPPSPFIVQQYKKLEKVPYGTIIIIIIAEAVMVKKINSSIHWSINKAAPSTPVSVSLSQYESFINSHSIIYEINSIHRDDTDFKTYAIVKDCSVLIGWADYYQQQFYIYK
ncbi:hypothetical protein R5Q34_004564 [Salmonella enterica]|nr:hypothetical protein [Salmonella enterica]